MNNCLCLATSPREGAGGWLRRAAARWAAAGLMLTSCACSTMDRPLADRHADPFLAEQPSAAAPADSPAIGDRRAPGRVVPASGESPPDSHQTFSSRAWDAQRQATRARPADGAIQRVSAEARLPLDCPPCPQDCPCDDDYFADEWLCDGGDRDLPVHYSETQMLGLDSEDTVIEYHDEEGRRRVKASNKVCVYSPRFAAVLAVSAPLEDVGGGKPKQAIATTRGVGLKGRGVTVAHDQRDALEGLAMRSRGSGLVSDAFAEELDRPQGIHGHIHTTTPLVALGFLQSGVVRQSEGAWLQESIQSAVVWTRDQNPVIAAVTDAAVELKGWFNAEEYVGRENRFNGKGRLRIVKLTDTEIAAPGDVITFKIRYDNVGDLELSAVTIIDNLTPRLEYVDDSATSDRDGEFFADDNGEGSVILRWELKEPLPGRTGGVVTFQARVR